MKCSTNGYRGDLGICRLHQVSANQDQAVVAILEDFGTYIGARKV
jgi:hypothetical protein